jgi:hypothetical protein
MMAKWYEQPYPGGKMVPVLGFPRNLYPPDDPNHATPVAGDDVEAYKRVVSRAGRWPWTVFDGTYSNGFAHGKSGNVGDSGIAGLQRQLGIDPTGNVGEKTFNAMRSIIIPAGLPNAGQHAMDPNAQTLIARAYRRFHPPQPPKLDQRELAVREAQKWIGTKESPQGSNMQQFGAWYGMNGVPWCAIFVTYCFELAGTGSATFKRGSYYSYVPNIVLDALHRRNGLSLTASPIRGDLICYDWDGGGFDHVGIFESGSASQWTSIEGNTGSYNYSNGGQVMRCIRSRSMARYTCFVRVAE